MLFDGVCIPTAHYLPPCHTDASTHHIEDSCQGATHVVEGHPKELEGEVIEGDHPDKHTGEGKDLWGVEGQESRPKGYTNDLTLRAVTVWYSKAGKVTTLEWCVPR